MENDINKYFPIGLIGQCHNIVDKEKFQLALGMLRSSIIPSLQDTFFVSDNIITWNKNFSFLRDTYYFDLLKRAESSTIEKSIIWRTYTLTQFAMIADLVEGDFIELGVLSGYHVDRVLECVSFKDRNYFLFDLFEWKEGDSHQKLQNHNDDLYQKVVNKYKPYNYIKIIRGNVPQSFNEGFPNKVAFAHIDMNNADPEVASIKKIIPILSKGGIIILDDYGWYGYRRQKIALDPVVKSFGLKIIELPTGQGLIINNL
jgi:hypothetical protein